MNLAKIGGTRFILTMMTGIATIVLVWFAKIDGATYSLVTLGTVGAYIGGNTLQRVKEINAPTDK